MDDGDFDPSLLMERSYFDILVDGEIIRNCQFLKSQITILVRHFVTVTMCPSEDDVSYLYGLIGDRGNGGEEVSRGMVVWWFQEMRQIFKRDKRIDLTSEKGWRIGLYSVVLGERVCVHGCVCVYVYVCVCVHEDAFSHLLT